MTIQFGEFVFDGQRRVLSRGSEPVHLSPKCFALLEMLIEHSPAAVSKKDLYDRLWPATFVEESNLKKLVAEARAALGEQSAVVRTVFGFGYAFEAVPVGGQRPLFYLLYDSETVRLKHGANVLGRDFESVVPIASSKVSRKHARIVISGTSATIEDLGSRNGTWLNGVRIGDETLLSDGDVIALGSVSVTFRSDPALQSTEGESQHG